MHCKWSTSGLKSGGNRRHQCVSLCAIDQTYARFYRFQVRFQQQVRHSSSLPLNVKVCTNLFHVGPFSWPAIQWQLCTCVSSIKVNFDIRRHWISGLASQDTVQYGTVDWLNDLSSKISRCCWYSDLVETSPARELVGKVSRSTLRSCNMQSFTRTCRFSSTTSNRTFANQEFKR